jgi:hypothetical protein
MITRPTWASSNTVIPSQPHPTHTTDPKSMTIRYTDFSR